MTVTAAALYGDLVARFPRAGGQYVYLREAFGPLIGFLYGWTLFLVIQTGTIAAVAVAFARHAAVLVPGLEGRDLGVGISGERALAIALIALLTFGNARGVEIGKRIQNLFTTVKVATLVALIALAFGLGFSGSVVAANFTAPFARAPGSLPLAAAIGGAMWARSSPPTPGTTSRSRAKGSVTPRAPSAGRSSREPSWWSCSIWPPSSPTSWSCRRSGAPTAPIRRRAASRTRGAIASAAPSWKRCSVRSARS
jgi:hypothetical protein